MSLTIGTAVTTATEYPATFNEGEPSEVSFFVIVDLLNNQISIQVADAQRANGRRDVIRVPYLLNTIDGPMIATWVETLAVMWTGNASV
jgi:hypothetical protein